MTCLKKETIQNQLNKLAFQESIPFCHACYIKAPTGVCDNCGTDDLMRFIEDSGCEWGTEWIIEELLDKHLEPFNQTESFESMIEDCYSEEIKVGWLNLNTADILKTMDEVSWEIAKDEYISSLEEDEEIMSFDNGKTYFVASDIEQLIEERLNEKITG